jgi:hypothetical protein
MTGWTTLALLTSQGGEVLISQDPFKPLGTTLAVASSGRRNRECRKFGTPFASIQAIPHLTATAVTAFAHACRQFRPARRLARPRSLGGHPPSASSISSRSSQRSERLPQVQRVRKCQGGSVLVKSCGGCCSDQIQHAI